MGDSSSKITIDADARKVVQAGEQSARAFHKVGDEVGAIGEGLEHVGHHLIAHLVGARALLRTFEQIGESVVKYQEGAKKASETVGGNILDRARAGGQLGMSDKETEEFTAPGVLSTKEMTSALGRLGSIRIGGRRPLDKDTVARAGTLLRSGHFTVEEVSRASEEGNLAALEQRLTALVASESPEFKKELAIRTAVNRADEDVDKRRANGDYRIGQAKIDVRNAKNPGNAFVGETLGGLPFIGPAFKSLQLQHASTSDETPTGHLQARHEQYLRSIAASSARAAGAADRPSLPPQVE